MNQPLIFTAVELPIDIAFSAGIGGASNCTNWVNKSMMWEDIVTMMSSHTPVPYTMAGYNSLGEGAKAVKDGKGFIGAKLVGNRKKNEDIVHRQLICLDADKADEDTWDVFCLHYKLEALCYSTISDSPAQRKLRIVIPLTVAVSPEQYEAIVRKLIDEIHSTYGVNWFDPCSSKPAQFMYLPYCCNDATPFADHYEGEAGRLKPDSILSRYKDWTDQSEWVYAQSEKEVRVRQLGEARKMMEDPTLKTGVIGAFCRTYTVEQAIVEFIPDVYIQKGNRYKYSGSVSMAGVEVYDGGKYIHSFHATDPYGGKTMNAFDMVRLHLYGHLDKQGEDVQMGNRESFKEMMKAAEADKAVKMTMFQERAESTDGDVADVEWMLALTTRRNSTDILPTVTNVVHILTNDPLLKGRIALNLFTEGADVMDDLPWRKYVNHGGRGDSWTDADDSGLIHYLAGGVYRMDCSDRTLAHALRLAFKTNEYHPVKEYLNTLPAWDGVKRIETLFCRYFDADDCEWTRLATRKMFLGAIHRVFVPGCEFENVLVLSGKQRIGKTTFFKCLAGAWYGSDQYEFKGQIARESMENVWISELGELEQMNKHETATIKSFLSKTYDKGRIPFDKHTTNRDRQLIFVGTTNEVEFLKGINGDRRFWPIPCNAPKRKPVIDTEIWDKEFIGQLWAEALVIYAGGEKPYLTDGEEEIAQEMQAAAAIKDDRALVVATYLDKLLPKNWNSLSDDGKREFLNGSKWWTGGQGTEVRMSVHATEIWKECFGEKITTLGSAHGKTLQLIMEQVGGWEYTHQVKIGGKNSSGYKRTSADRNRLLEELEGKDKDPELEF